PAGANALPAGIVPGRTGRAGSTGPARPRCVTPVFRVFIHSPPRIEYPIRTEIIDSVDNKGCTADSSSGWAPHLTPRRTSGGPAERSHKDLHVPRPSRNVEGAPPVRHQTAF